MTPEIAGTKKEHFQKGTKWLLAYLVDSDGMEVGADFLGASRVAFKEITVTSVGKVFATVQTRSFRERVQPHYLASRGYRISKAEAVAELRMRVGHRLDRAQRNLEAANAANALVGLWKENP